jgi:predicted transcriptional regulator
MPVANVKTEAQAILDRMPENATWDDLMYEIYVRQAIDAGLEDSAAGRTMDVKDVRAEFGLPE